MQRPAPEVQALIARAERLDELADTAELMGDDATAAGLRTEATRCREHAMTHLDEAQTH